MLKIFLLTKNEIDMVEDWIKYHGYLFGFENIHVIDGSDMQEIFEIYEKYQPHGLNVHHSDDNLNDIQDTINECMNHHKGENNFLIKMDTDEYLAYIKPFDFSTLSSVRQYFIRRCLDYNHSAVRYCAQKCMNLFYANMQLMNENIKQVFSTLPITGQKYKAALTAWSIPTVHPTPRPCSELTSFTPNQFTHFKSFFHSESFQFVDLGGHNGKTTHDQGAINTGLTIIHYHSTSVENSMERARQVLISHQFIKEGDSLKEAKEKLQNLQTMDSHHKVSMYLGYIDSIEGNYPLPPDSLNKYHPFYYPTKQIRQITLVKETLAKIDLEISRKQLWQKKKSGEE